MTTSEHAINTLIYFFLRAPIDKLCKAFVINMGDEIESFLANADTMSSKEERKFIKSSIRREFAEGIYLQYENYYELFREFISEFGYDDGTRQDYPSFFLDTIEEAILREQADRNAE